eukprot:9372379-Prorocentrum_lima.AAC.1
MTSSLVGSEMCIRDRACSLAREFARGLSAPKTGRKKNGRCSTDGEPPVSYTHLTLPTICSV